MANKKMLIEDHLSEEAKIMMASSPHSLGGESILTWKCNKKNYHILGWGKVRQILRGENLDLVKIFCGRYKLKDDGEYCQIWRDCVVRHAQARKQLATLKAGKQCVFVGKGYMLLKTMEDGTKKMTMQIVIHAFFPAYVPAAYDIQDLQVDQEEVDNFIKPIEREDEEKQEQDILDMFKFKEIEDEEE